MKNNNGFTLIELLSVIVLIGLLLGLGVPGVMKISDNMKKRSYNTKIGLIEQAGTLWGQDNKTRLQSSGDCDIGDNENNSVGTYKCKKITINELIDDDYLEADSDKTTIENEGLSNEYIIYEYLNPEDNTNITLNCVYVYKKNNRVYAYYSGTTC